MRPFGRGQVPYAAVWHIRDIPDLIATDAGIGLSIGINRRHAEERMSAPPTSVANFGRPPCDILLAVSGHFEGGRRGQFHSTTNQEVAVWAGLASD